MGITIQTAKSHLRYETLEQYRAWLQGISDKVGHRVVSESSDLNDKALPAVAYVNHGRWVADCPSGCGGAMLLDPTIPFMCGECFNVELGGKWRRIEWPNDRLKIEFYLERRVLPHTANWRPGETLEALQAENIERGVV